MSPVLIRYGVPGTAGVTRLRRYYETCPPPQAARPVPHGRPVEGDRPHRLGFPVLRQVSLSRHAVAITPVGPLGRIARGPAYSSLAFIPATSAFPAIVAGSAPTLVLSRPARRSLALRPAGSLHRQAAHLSRRLRRLRYLHRRSDSFRLERPSCRVGIAPTEDQRLSRRTTKADTAKPQSLTPRSPTDFPSVKKMN